MHAVGARLDTKRLLVLPAQSLPSGTRLLSARGRIIDLFTMARAMNITLLRSVKNGDV